MSSNFLANQMKKRAAAAAIAKVANEGKTYLAEE